MYDKNKTMTDCMHQLQEANTLSIGWRRLMEGMISRELVELQKCALVEAESWLTWRRNWWPSVESTYQGCNIFKY
jgi:hypothetical protein